MAQIILAINAGSSSVKVSVYSAEKDGHELENLAEAEVSGLSSPPAKLKYSCKGEKKSTADEIDKSEGVDSQNTAFQYILKTLMNDKHLTELASEDHIGIAAHRVVHGGDYSEPQVIDKETMHHIEELTDLAPLHNASALEIVRACIEKLPKTRNIAVFDSQFHQTIPEHVRTIPINQEIAKQNRLRKYVGHQASKTLEYELTMDRAFMELVMLTYFGKLHPIYKGKRRTSQLLHCTSALVHQPA